MKSKSIPRKIWAFFKSLFLNGLFTILPLAVTLFLLNFTYTLLANWLQPLKNIEPEFMQKIPGAEIIIVILAIFAIGALLKVLIITPIIHHFEEVITKIPIIRTVYSSAKTLVNFFNVPNTKAANKKIVLIEFPRKGTFNIAFLLGSAKNDFGKLIPNNTEKKYFKVFMPNSPNPTTGYFFMLPEDEIIHTNITFEEAIKTIVSCGLITPETLKQP